MRGVVNHLGHFTDIYIGWLGRVHDARVLADSTLYHKGQNSTLKTIAGKDVPVVLLTDPAYPLLPLLMKAFPDTGSLTQRQRTFNYKLSSARVIVEHAYGRLKGKWRCLLKQLDVHVKDVPELVSACCVLHKICEIHGKRFDKEWLNGVGSDIPSNQNPANYSESGDSIRDAFMSYFHEE